MTDLVNKYRIPTKTTKEVLESRWSKVLNFGDKVLLAGYFYSPDGNSYFGAIYEFLGEDHTCEGIIGLREVSEDMFVDDGHAIEWALKQK